jgi:fructosamine-3-kinase
VWQPKLEVNEGDTDAQQLWSKLKPKVPEFFSGVRVKPALLHGDLWSGNAGQAEGKPGANPAASQFTITSPAL